MAEKTISKNIKFNYFQAYLEVDKAFLSANDRKVKALEKMKDKIDNNKKLTKYEQELQKDKVKIQEEQILYETFGRSEWNALDMFTCIKEMKINTNLDFDEINAEIEPNTLKIDGNIVSFQLTKLRDNMIPAKKKKGHNKEDIKLNDDEYIGEFVSILYDAENYVFMIQSNMYGLSIGQIKKYLTELRRVLEIKKSDELKQAACELSPVINIPDIGNIKSSKELKKLRIRAADSVFSKFEDSPNNYLGNIRKSFNNKIGKGLVIDISVSIDKENDAKTLRKDLVNDLLDNMEKIESSRYDSNLLVEITRKEDDDSTTEILNLLSPRVTDLVTLKLKPRTSIVQEKLIEEMRITYAKRKKMLDRILEN